ncbi:MAG: stage II sporulation protein R [Oscillospiraceae bacterium]
MKQHLKKWEISLLFALCITLSTGLWARAEQRKLSNELVRLHVVAASNSDDDQAVKLRVRDGILAYLSPKLEGVSDVREAQKIIHAELPALCSDARDTLHGFGKYYDVSASICREKFPTREYKNFALPAGEYLSLRVTLGGGFGHNWWCVVFPPLCMTAAQDAEAFSGISESSAKLIGTSDGEYRLKFHIIELFEQIRGYMA